MRAGVRPISSAPANRTGVRACAAYLSSRCMRVLAAGCFVALTMCIADRPGAAHASRTALAAPIWGPGAGPPGVIAERACADGAGLPDMDADGLADACEHALAE